MSGARIRTAQRVVLALVLILAAAFAAVLHGSAAKADPDTCGVAGNLVANCGFESGDFPPWIHVDSGQTAPGEVSTDDPHSGAYDYYDGAVQSPDTLSQDLTVTPGDTYQLNFYAKNDEPDSAESFVASVTFNHSAGGSTTDPVFTDDNTITNSYAQYGGSFTVPSDATTTATLTFAIQQVPSYYHVDDVSVAPPSGPPPPPPTASVSLSASPSNGSTEGDPVTLTADVSGSGPAPTGTVQFDSNGSPITGCASLPLSPTASSATATCQTSDLAAGDDTLLVIYSGDSNYPGGPSNPIGYQVTPATTPTPTPSPTPKPTPTPTPSPTPSPSSSSSVQCPPDNPCTVTVAGAGGNSTATIHAKSGPNGTKVKASFGTAPGKVHPCAARKRAILTFSGNRKKTITMKFHSSHARHRFCYGQTKPFITASGHLTKRFNSKNHEYEGILPKCRVTHTRPCVKRHHFHHKIQTVVVKSGKIDPRLSY